MSIARSQRLTSTPKSSDTPKRTPVPLPQSNKRKLDGLDGLLDRNGEKKRVTAAMTNGVSNAKRAVLDESRAVVVAQPDNDGDVTMADSKPEVIEIEDDDSESSEYESEEEEAQTEAKTPKSSNPVSEVVPSSYRTAPEAADEEDGDGASDDQDEVSDNEEDVMVTDEVEEPSFGDILRANAPEPVQVDTAPEKPENAERALTRTSKNKQISVPTATTLGTVLTQALRTNDNELLESCFQMNDLDGVRSTIERLQSKHVADLLKRLAERLHKRPGRAGNLMVWVQWSLVSHGGYLAGQPKVIKKLSALHRVMKERASGLQPLLTLKGKLDMLSAQVDVRKRMARASGDLDDDEEAVIYVEGEESEEEDKVPATRLITDGINEGIAPPKRLAKGGRLEDYADVEGSEESEDDEDDDMPNGIAYEEDEASEDEGDESEDDELVDTEAEETDRDTGDDLDEDDMEEEEDDGESLGIDDEDEEDEEEEIPAKSSRSALASSGRRR